MDYLIKASAVIALFYLCFYFFLKKETFFQHNRWFLLIGVIIALIFPFIVIPIHIAVEPILVPETAFAISENIPANIQKSIAEPGFEWQTLLPIIYGIGLIVFLIQFLFQFGSLILLLLKNPKNKDGIYTYVIVDNKISPFSFFKWIVYNPESFNSEELKLMLTHEKVHASQLHSIDILMIQLACSIFWFNPLMWLYRKEVRQNLEYIADYKTQTTSENEKEYQHLLLKTSVANHNISISNNFYNSLIKERIIMLKKSRSNRKKQWRYLLMLPLLAGLLMSMNTEKVYIETEPTIKAYESTIEFVVTKNTTDSELRTMSNTIENKGGTLVFSEIERNDTNELTSIFLKLNNHSHGNGSGNSNQPMEPFLIYKEFFGFGGGYAGTNGQGTMHFDDNKNDDNPEFIKAFKMRTNKVLLKNKLQTLRLNNIREQNKIDFKAKPTKSVKKASINKPNKNTKNIAMAVPVKSKKKLHIDGNISMTLITKNTTKSELDDIKNRLKKEGLTVKFKGVKRNKNGEITAIKIDVKSKKSNASYNVNSDEAIDSIKIIYDEDKNSISIGNGYASHEVNTFTFKSKDGNHQIHKSGSGSNVFVISDEEHEHDEEHKHDEEHEHDSKIIIKRNGKKGKLKRIKKNKNVHVISGDDGEVIEIMVDEDDNDNKETIIVNGKKVNIVEGKENIVVRGKANIVVKGRENIVVKGKATNVWVTNIDDKDDAFVLEIDDSKKNIFISGDNNKNPLFIIDGEEVTKDAIVDLKSDSIESVTILKDKNAIEKYGKKGKDGVIIIKTKKKN